METEHDIVRSSGEDPRQKALSDDLQETSRNNEAREAEIYGGLYAREIDHAVAADISRRRMHEEEESDHRRILRMRAARRDLDEENTGLHEVAGTQYAELGIEYVPGKTTVADLYQVDDLSDTEAAEEAGLPAVFRRPERWLRILKVLAMAGAAILGTVGMGSFFLKRSPVQLLASPALLAMAVAVAALLLVGTYLGPFMMWARAGAFAAASSESGHTRRAIRNARLMTAVVIPFVSLVDAEMIASLNAARDMVDPGLRTPFGLVLAVAAGFNALYVLGVSVFAYNDGYGAQAEAMMDSKKARSAMAQRKEARAHVESKLACDAMNAVSVNEMRRERLGSEIEAAAGDFRAMAAAHESAIPAAPELSEEDRTEILVRRKKETYAARRLRAISGRRIGTSPDADRGGRS